MNVPRREPPGINDDPMAAERAIYLAGMGRMKPGYDGNAPQFRETRDLAGKGKREAVDGPTNIRVDRLEWLLAHKRIELHQHQAGRTLQGDAELAEIRGYATLGSVRGGGGATRLSDAKCDAIGRVNAARGHIGSKGNGWRLLELVVVENQRLEDAAKRLRMPTRGALPVLQSNLDTLWTHYDQLGRFSERA